VHSRLSFPSFSLSLSLPLSGRLITEELLGVLGLEADMGTLREGEAGVVFEVPVLGKARRYQPPVYVKATSWCLVASPWPSAPSVMGISIHPTVHLSSSGTSAVGDRGEDVEMEMCEDCAGIRYCA
jgi:hypothetical protein